ncbi:MAG: hypothetical protein SFU27_13505 [Thermonemataceae bacterium]|nr:hypothetical protein [Thermonemataceae bacterium]
MLDYFKLILEKVSFDKQLFEKELRKALAYLQTQEQESLKKWCYAKFGVQYGNILNSQFNKMVLS